MNSGVPVIEIVAYTAAAGACVPAGGLLAKVEHIRPAWMEREFRHFVVAFGGGILLAAVALVLMPEGIAQVQTPGLIMIYFIAGGLAFFVVERALGLRKRESPQFLATLLDYVPESIALGGVFALGSPTAPLLALLIGMQNLPEGFNSYRELKARSGLGARRIVLLMLLLVPLGPVLAVIGWLFLSRHTHFLGAVMLFASGGILYLIFQDIAPQARLKNHWFPPLGAVSGFGLGLLGHLALGGG
jgi:ZIP family zinc transporter